MQGSSSTPISSETPLHYDGLTIPGTIRLLALHKSPDWDHIRTSLRTVHLHDTVGKNAFTALSYAPGNASAHTYPLQCDGRVARISSNLFAFLAALRTRLNATEQDDQAVWLLWVDALCINQADVAERNAQAPLRGEVYQRAKEVWVWLGEGDDSSSSAVMAFVEWSKIWTGLREPRLTAKARDEYAKWFQHRWSEVKVQAAGVFVARPWFRWAGGFAEVVVSRKTVLLWCGGERLDWRYFVDAYEGLWRAGMAGRVFGGNSNVHILVKWWLLRQNTVALAEWWDGSISHLLQMTNGQEVLDPKDRIFSVLGILAASTLDRAFFVQQACHITYESPVQEVFTRYAVLMIRQEKSLRTLSHCYRGPIRSGDLPSWVPDWRLSPMFQPLRKFGIPTDRCIGAKISSDSPIVFVDPATSCLHLRGALLGQISAIYSIYDDLPRVDSSQVMVEGLIGIRDLYNTLGCFPTFEGGGFKSRAKPSHSPADFLSTLCGGNLPRELHGSQLSWEDERSEFPNHFSWEVELGWRDEGKRANSAEEARPDGSIAGMFANALEDAHQAMLSFPTKGKTSPRFKNKMRSALFGPHVSVAYLGLADVRARMATEIARFMRQTMKHRVFFMTNDGAMGIGPATALVGDKIFALRGWCTPFLVRPMGRDEAFLQAGDHIREHSGKEYEMIGDVHLHGLGEIPGIDMLLDDFKDGRIKSWSGQGSGKASSSKGQPNIEEVVLV